MSQTQRISVKTLWWLASLPSQLHQQATRETLVLWHARNDVTQEAVGKAVKGGGVPPFLWWHHKYFSYDHHYSKSINTNYTLFINVPTWFSKSETKVKDDITITLNTVTPHQFVSLKGAVECSEHIGSVAPRILYDLNIRGMTLTVEEPKCVDRNLSQRHITHHKSPIR